LEAPEHGFFRDGLLRELQHCGDDGSRGRVVSPLLLGIFTGLAVCLAMAGVYGVRAYLVGQRSSEIGLRMALGAAPRDVSRLMIRQALRLAAVGLAIGLVGSLAASYFRASRLDPLATLRT